MKKSRSSYIDLNGDNSDTNSLKNFEELEQIVRTKEKIAQIEIGHSGEYSPQSPIILTQSAALSSLQSPI